MSRISMASSSCSIEHVNESYFVVKHQFQNFRPDKYTTDLFSQLNAIWQIPTKFQFKGLSGRTIDANF